MVIVIEYIVNEKNMNRTENNEVCWLRMVKDKLNKIRAVEKVLRVEGKVRCQKMKN